MGPKAFRSPILDQLNSEGRVSPVMVNISYDANGNTLSDAQGRGFTWDFENRLTQVVNPGVGTTTFRYDPFGRRIQKSGPLGATIYLYDGENSVEEVDFGGNVLARYAQGVALDEPCDPSPISCPIRSRLEAGERLDETGNPSESEAGILASGVFVRELLEHVEVSFLWAARFCSLGRSGTFIPVSC